MSSSNVDSTIQDNGIGTSDDESGDEEWAKEKKKIMEEQRIKGEKYEARKKALLEKLTKKKPPPVYPRPHPTKEGVQILYDKASTIIELWPGDIVVKKGGRVRPEEWEALRQAEKMDVPAPRLLTSQRDEDGRAWTIHMTHFKGTILEDAWPSRTAEQKKEIAAQLKAILRHMRSHFSETGLIGAAQTGIVRDHRHFTEYEGGPWMDQEQFRKFNLDLFPNVPDAIQKTLVKKFQKDYRIVFTHGDLCPSNIMLDLETNKVEGILDWEFAGWYPEWWDYIKFFDAFTANREWLHFANDIFPETYNDELIDWQAFKRWQKP